NCYVIPFKDDSIESIFQWMKEAARTYSLGGGVGGDISVLRPAGAPVNNAARTSTGSISFMELMSLTTGTIGQSGRRGALMITIADNHPDVLEFTKIKRNLSRVRYANISVRISDAFMRAVEADGDWELSFENDRASVQRTVRAREVWNELVRGARDYAEPGVIFWDTIKRWSTTEYNGMNVITTNPCSEIPLEPYGACCLGNLGLAEFVRTSLPPRLRWTGFTWSRHFVWPLASSTISSTTTPTNIHSPNSGRPASTRGASGSGSPAWGICCASCGSSTTRRRRSRSWTGSSSGSRT